MTEYIEIEYATVGDVRDGDRVTFTHGEYPEAGEIRGTASGTSTASSIAGCWLASPVVALIKVERPVPGVPTGAGAVIRAWNGSYDMYYVLAHPEAVNYQWRSHGGGDFLVEDMARILAEGGEVLFEGVEK